MAISNLPKLNFSVPFAMTAALPVEYNAYFDSYDAAVAAAATADVPGSSTTVYYYGQKIVVVTAESADLYIIQPDKTLKAAGTVPVGDNKSITVSDGVIGITGFAAATENQQPRKKADGTIEWYTPDTSTVAGLIQTVGQHTQQISTLNEQMTTVQGDITTINSTLADKANSADVYTKQQTDDKISAAISSVYKPAGSTTFAALPAPAANVLGNIYNVTDAFTTTADFAEGAGVAYPAGTKVAIINTGTDASPMYKYDAYNGKELTAGAGIVIESQAVGLLPKYNSYLVRATFEKPVLSLTMSGVGGAKEIGTPLTISAITHNETHADNIAAGTLKFYRNNAEVQVITPSASSATVTLDEAITEAGTSAGSVSYKLQCTDTLGDTRSSSTITATWNRYVYSQVGDPETVPKSAENCVKQANLATFAANGADFNYAVGDCIWLLTTNANAKIQTNVLGQWVDVTYYSGGSVTFTQANGATATYYAYRTDAFIGAGTAKYRITNP